MARARNRAKVESEMDDAIYHVLLGDPRPNYVALWEQALTSSPFFTFLDSVGDISGLVSYLAAAGNFVDKARFPSPHLVLLDLNLSGPASAFDVLQWIQRQPSRHYRIVVLSGDADDLLREQAFALGADGFVAQPNSLDEIVRILARIEGWLRASVRTEDASEFCVS